SKRFLAKPLPAASSAKSIASPRRIARPPAGSQSMSSGLLLHERTHMTPERSFGRMHRPSSTGINMSESFAELFEESLKSLDMQPGAIITGIVVDIDGDWVTVHAGLKSEGVIPVEQFFNEQGELTIKVGDEVHVALDAVED